MLLFLVEVAFTILINGELTLEGFAPVNGNNSFELVINVMKKSSPGDGERMFMTKEMKMKSMHGLQLRRKGG